MEINDILMKQFGISERIINIVLEEERRLQPHFVEHEHVAFHNQLKVVKAMQDHRLSESHFAPTTGYGYGDSGRVAIESIYAQVFNGEDALVRPQIVSGTHGLTLVLTGNLRAGDELLSAAGAPYDTLLSVIGKRETRGSLIEHGIIYRQAELAPDGTPDYRAIGEAITSKTKVVLIQRSKGYAFRPSLTIEHISRIIETVKSRSTDAICLVDNCYGEFVELLEPGDVGADLTVGSLIKNPGGGIAPCGGYIVGKKELVENAAFKLTAPGIGKEAGPMLGMTGIFAQGLFFAPHFVLSACKNAMIASAVFERLGFKVLPLPDDYRSDIVQAIQLNSEENVVRFCQGIQRAAAVDSFVTPEPWDMPGYGSKVIMAAGCFIQGASIELSADAPIVPPYNVYFQGGLNPSHGKLGIMMAAEAVTDIRL